MMSLTTANPFSPSEPVIIISRFQKPTLLQTSPLRIDCATSSEIPSAEQIGKIVGPDNHLVLQFPQPVDKAPIIAKLSSSLPECSVFDSGGDSKTERVTVMAVVSTASVRSHEKEIREAMERYIQACATLVAQMNAGMLPKEWSADAHGRHCAQ
jgi:hypothetical protein